MEKIVNPRRKFHKNIEYVPIGYSNGSALKPGETLSEQDKEQMIEEASELFGKFMDILKVDWRNDPNAKETPYRFTKSLVEDWWKGRYEPLPDVTSFPNDNYEGMVMEKIPLNSMCSHHLAPIIGTVYCAYIPGENGRVIGLSKLNRITEHFGRRGQIQESLTMAIHNAIDKVCEGNIGVAVMVKAKHMCTTTRGIKHHGSQMVTSHLSGAFKEKPEVRNEFLHAVNLSNE